MHRTHATAALTPFQVFGHLARLRQEGRKLVDFELVGAPAWTPDDKSTREGLLSDLAGRIADIGLPSEHPWRGVGLDVVIPVAVARLMTRVAQLKDSIEAWHAKRAELALLLEVSEPQALSETPSLVALARRLASAPDLEAGALAGRPWDDRTKDAVRLLEVGREFERLSQGLDGLATREGLNAPVADVIQELASLPQDFSTASFDHVRSLRTLLPRLMAEADRLEAELGASGGERTLASIARMTTTGERVAAAPDASPEAFAATVWDHGVEQAGDLAEAVATLEGVRRAIEGHVTDAAWTTDVTASRQALASHTGVLRLLNADWRRANALVKTVLREPGAALPDLLARLDALSKGQAALRAIAEGDAFGRSAFGPDWRGSKSASAPLVALVEWMRTLRGLGAEPRLIAGRVPERSALGDRSAAVRKLLNEIRPSLDGLWADLGGSAASTFGNVPSADRAALSTLSGRIVALAQANEASLAVVPDAVSLAERLDVLRRIVARQAATTRLAEAAEFGTEAFGAAWAGSGSDWSSLARAAHWIASNQDIRHLAARVTDRTGIADTAGKLEAGRDAIVQAVDDVFTALNTDAAALFGLGATADLSPSELTGRFAIWLDHAEQLSQWAAYRDRADRGRELGLAAIVDRLRDGRLPPADTLAAFEMAFYEALLADLMRSDPELGRFDGTLHGARAREFADLDRQRISTASLEVVRAHHRRIPPPGGVGPVGVLRAEMARRRGHMPIRQLMQRASPAIQALKPVLMMSPLSVAQFLTPGRMTFDLLVMDEASQIQPVDALGAIARCKQVVVVGDERQLPPTQFFARMTGNQLDDADDEEGAGVADIESILGLFTARGLPQRMLRWHYRSRHQSLIAVSNHQFYESKLFIVPSPYTQEAGMGLSFRHVPNGVFDSGGTGTNPIEAKLVAHEVIRHAKIHPNLSLGVATFSSKQRRAIQDELEVLRRLNPDTEDFFHAHPGEPFFVKNLENVQGDERDVIMISVGYGRNAQGYMAMRFGPLGADGGERRLNVLISRAKRRCEVFASITDEDIDTERAKGRGVFAFKLFLHYARTGRLAIAGQAGRVQDSVFEEQVAKALQERGHQVHPQVGIAGFFIDLAIADPERPGRYLLGIECDGAAYHSSRSARDRDRLRQAVLEDHGWIIHRIWGADWFQRPQEQLERAIAAIAAAKVALDERLELGQAASRAVPVTVVTVERSDVTEIGLADIGDRAVISPLYQEAVPKVPISREMHETPSGLMAELIEQVVAVEGPVHLDEVVVRLRTAWGLQRAGGRIQAAVERGLDVAVQRGRVRCAGPFLSLPGQVAVARDRGAVLSSALRKPEMLPFEELEAAILRVVRANLGASMDEVVSTVPRLMGFKAASAQLRQLIRASVDQLQKTGSLVLEGALLVAATSSPASAGPPEVVS